MGEGKEIIYRIERMRQSLIPQYREMHEHAHFSGMSLYKYADDIAALVLESGAKTLLDYGSGKGRQYAEGRAHELWGGIMPRLYDPAVESLAERPLGQFDGVICTDVMEHIPESEVLETLSDIRAYVKMWCFLSICCRPAKKYLPDGRNVHVTLREEAWWLERIAKAFNGLPVHVRFERLSDRKKPFTRIKNKESWKKEKWSKKDPPVCVRCGVLWNPEWSYCKSCGGHYTLGRAKGAAPKAWNVMPDGTWVPKPALAKKL